MGRIACGNFDQSSTHADVGHGQLPTLLSVGMWFTITLKRRETFALDVCL